MEGVRAIVKVGRRGGKVGVKAGMIVPVSVPCGPACAILCACNTQALCFIIITIVCFRY